MQQGNSSDRCDEQLANEEREERLEHEEQVLQEKHQDEVQHQEEEPQKEVGPPEKPSGVAVYDTVRVKKGEEMEVKTGMDCESETEMAQSG